MTNRPSALLAAFCGIVIAATPALTRAAGFSLTEQSSVGLGMASAVSASTTEPAAVWYNPAALSFMPGYQVSLTGVAYLAQTSFSPRDRGSDSDAKSLFQLVPGFFATAQLSDAIALGLGVSVPFGLTVSWPEDWVGRVYGIFSSITTVNFNPVISVKILPNLSLAAGPDLMKSAVDITNGLPTSPTDSVHVGADAWGIGGNVGILYRWLPEKFHLAAAYRSRAKFNFKGRGHFELQEPVFSSQLFDQSVKAPMTLPDIITLGAMFRPHSAVTIGLDAIIVTWSTYDQIPIDFEDRNTPDSGLYPDYHDVVSLRVGAEWSTPVRGLKLRGGFLYDQNPAPKTGVSPTLPDSTALDFCLGLGYHSPYVGADLGYMFALYLPSKTAIPTDPADPPQSLVGTYRTTAHLIGLTLTGRIGASVNQSETGAATPEPEATASRD